MKKTINYAEICGLIVLKNSLKEMINDMSEEELRDAYLNMLIEHGEMAELFGLDEEEEMFEDEFY